MVRGLHDDGDTFEVSASDMREIVKMRQELIDKQIAAESAKAYVNARVHGSMQQQTKLEVLRENERRREDFIRTKLALVPSSLPIWEFNRRKTQILAEWERDCHFYTVPVPISAEQQEADLWTARFFNEQRKKRQAQDAAEQQFLATLAPARNSESIWENAAHAFATTVK